MALSNRISSLQRVYKRLPQFYKFSAYGVVVFFAILPFVSISFFQQMRLAQQTVDELALSLDTVLHQAEKKKISPEATVDWVQNHKLVQWAKYYQNNNVVASAGLPPGRRGEDDPATITVVINPDLAIAPQLPESRLQGTRRSEYHFVLPIKNAIGGEKLELGVSYRSLFSAAQDVLYLSGAFFFVAFLFLLGAVIFLDAYVSIFTEKVIGAIRQRSSLTAIPEVSRFLSPTFTTLMEALEYREDQVLDTRNMMETVFNGMKNGVAMVSTEMKIVLVNKYFKDLLGTGESHQNGNLFLSEPCSSLNLPGQTPSVESLCARALESLAVESQEIPSSDGRSFIQEAYPLLDVDGKPVAVILHCRDITKEKVANEIVHKFNEELQRQLNDHKKQLEEAQQKMIQSARLAAIGELAGGVAHEINNPNGLILMGAKYALSRLENEAAVPDYVTRYLSRICKQSERVAQIVSALLTYSRQQPQNKEAVNIENVIDDALELAASRFGSRKIVVQQTITPGLPALFGNRFQLGQVLINLINNSVDALPDGGRIEISAERTGENQNPGIIVRVRDTGEGIKPEIINKVTEPFFTTKPVGKGTGLGLSVSQGIINEHGGSMHICNHPEGGAVFELTFPENR